LAGPILVALALGISACTVRPLYSTTAAGTPLQAELAAISILPAGDRLTQIVRNELTLAFGGGTAFPLYEMSVVASGGGGTGLNVTAPGNVASTVVAVTVRFTLIEIATGDVVEVGTVTAETRFERSNQAFTNLRAREDAQQRAAIAAADMVRLEVSAALAARP
jgi:LPS-assembly lipoprotein